MRWTVRLGMRLAVGGLLTGCGGELDRDDDTSDNGGGSLGGSNGAEADGPGDGASNGPGDGASNGPGDGPGTSDDAGSASASATSGSSAGTADDDSGSAEGAMTTGGACIDGPVFEGQATYYDLATPLANCSFETPTLPQYYGALNTMQYADSATCGACARVTGPEGTIDIQIVDQCPIDSNPICTMGHIDLNPPAFDAIGEIIDGIIPITWEFIPCDTPGPIEYYFKDGSSQFWTAVQIRNHRHAIVSVEYQGNDGGWNDMPRADYNFFLEEAGMGPPPYTLRVTDVHGHTLVDEGIPLDIMTPIPGAAQLPECD